jgi:hypothetical protein
MALDSQKNSRWKNRLIIVSESNVGAQKHFEEIKLKLPDAWKDRRLKLVTLTQIEFNKATNGNKRASAGLLGLDGELKQIYVALPRAKEIFQIIDAMPMRVDEMINRK